LRCGEDRDPREGPRPSSDIKILANSSLYLSTPLPLPQKILTWDLIPISTWFFKHSKMLSVLTENNICNVGRNNLYVQTFLSWFLLDAVRTLDSNQFGGTDSKKLFCIFFLSFKHTHLHYLCQASSNVLFSSSASSFPPFQDGFFYWQAICPDLLTSLQLEKNTLCSPLKHLKVSDNPTKMA